ncbi:hypothetical protein NKI51_25805 [Mesorhizobium australicum]|uniref:carbonic anhydrase n=1 Tax=Mesorhizobium australicum TaxID=536018 RepID=UPI001FD9AEDB|nr:carbonic anhydrase [Mesorhizobium sp. LNHC209A00]
MGHDHQLRRQSRSTGTGGHGVGELFIARNAGNLVDTATLGTVEYGAAVLGSPLIVVLATAGPVITDIVPLLGRGALFRAPFRNSISKACRPTSRSSAAIRGS